MLKSKFLIPVTSIFLFFLYYGFTTEDGNYSFRVLITSYLICLYSSICFFSNSVQPFSLYKIFFIFSFFFFGLAPIQQYISGASFFGSRQLLELEYFYLNVLLLIVIFFYTKIYIFYYKRIPVNTQSVIVNNKFSMRSNVVFIILPLLSFLVVFYFNNFDILSLMFRGGAEKSTSFSSKSEALIVTRFIQPLSAVCLIFYLLHHHKKNIFFTVYLILFCLLTASPFGMARFATAALYIPVFLVSFNIFRTRNLFTVIFVLSLLVVFPFLEQFRNFSKSNSITLDLDFSMFREAHFDSYHNFAIIMFDDFVTYGRQLLGVIFFWVPRSIWADKPIGSGHYISGLNDLDFSNISANFFAEGYINFGFFGIILFLFVLAYFTSSLDKKFWSSSSRDVDIVFKVQYLIFLSMLFFILRGDLMSSFAFSIGYFLSVYFVSFLLKIR